MIRYIDNKFNILKLMNVKKSLNESIYNNNKILDIINDFIKYCDNFLSLNNEIPDIILINDSEYAKKYHTYGKYIPNNNEIIIVISNRSIGDILRTLSHELIHHKQNTLKLLNKKSGETGSNEENVANSLAGVIMRNYGSINPNIYE